MPKFRKTGKLGPAIIKCRQDAGLTQDELADRMGVSKTLISQLENGVTGLTEGSLEALLDALNISLLTFFTAVWEETDFGKRKPHPAAEKKTA